MEGAMPEEQAGAGYISLSLAELSGRVQPPLASLPVQNPKLLPLTELEPETFEWLIAEIVSRQDNRGVQFYGRSGQKQHGLDIVAREPDQRRSLYQVKRYQQLTVPLIKEAVETYAGAPRPKGQTESPRLFDPYRFIVVTSAELDSDTAYVRTVSDLQDAYTGDLEIEFWGAEAVGRKLRDATNLVAAVFGEVWAKAWCGVMPAPNDAAAPKPLGLVSGPIAVLGLQSLEDDAQASESDPARAARLYGELADALTQGNFPGHAAQVRTRQARMTRSAGNVDAAFDLLFDLQLHEILRGQPSARTGSLEALASEAAQPRAAKWTVLECVANWYEQGSRLPRTVPALRQLTTAADPHASLLCCLVLEQALVDGLCDSPASSLVVEPEDAPPALLGELRELADGAETRDVFIRARLACAVADASLRLDSVPEDVQSVYGPLVSAAGAGRYQQARGLITSRAARAFALRGAPDRAEELWNQSVLACSEDGWFGDARFALRAARQLATDQGRLVLGLDAITRALPNRKQLLAGTFNPALTAYEVAHHEKLPDAFGDTRRYLWESRLQGAWQEELMAMELFGDVLAAAGHLAEAVQTYVWAGAAEKAADLAGSLTETVDVQAWLASPVRRCRATAFQVLGEQAPFIADADVAGIVRMLLRASDGVWQSPAIRPHPELDALKTVRAFAIRIPESAVSDILQIARPALASSTRISDDIADLLIQTYWAVESRRREIAEALDLMLRLPDPPDRLWDLVENIPGSAREPLLPYITAMAADGRRPAVEVLARWRIPSHVAQVAVRGACAALLRRPVGVEHTVTHVGTQEAETVDLLLALLDTAELEEVPPSALSTSKAQPAGGVLYSTSTSASFVAPSADAPEAADTVGTPAESPGSPPSDLPDDAAEVAAGPPQALAEAVAAHLTAMAEDSHDSAASRGQAAQALRKLARHLPQETAAQLARRLTALHQSPGYSETDLWEMNSSGLSRFRTNAGSDLLAGRALAAGADMFAASRNPDTLLTAEEQALAEGILAAATQLLRSERTTACRLGAVSIIAVASAAPAFTGYTTSLLVHSDTHVRALGAQHAPGNSELLKALAQDPAFEVRVALASKGRNLPEEVRRLLARDPHVYVRHCLAHATDEPPSE
ncbi:hypothetical protein ABT030_44070 [Streptomyces mirabilis]|uniref:hypothetical protein n=1 Tax=Streptomyces mirabilis TaxID=68239 RepID=UPI00331E0203